MNNHKNIILQRILLAFFTLLFAGAALVFVNMVQDLKSAEQYTGTVFIDTGTDGYSQTDVIEAEAGSRGPLKVKAEAKSGREDRLPKPGDTVSLTLTKDTYGGDIWKIGTTKEAITNSTIFLITSIGCTVLFAYMLIRSF